MSVPDNYEIIQVVSSNATIRVDIDWEYQSIDELYVWQQDSATGDIFYFNLGDFAVVEKSDGSGDYIEVENVATAEAVVFTARNTAKTQTYELENSEPLDPVALIEALDKAIKLIQENYSQLGTPDKRAITSVNPFEIPDKQTRKLTYVSFDENGDLRLDDEIDKIVGWAKEWAINPEDDLVSTEAGGNGVDDYSSLHHSRKSEDFSEKSDQWANEAEDVEVETGKYSSRHWSEKSSGFSDDSSSSATDSANSATNSANSATSSANSATASATSAGNALASENKANLWAEEAVDVPVETGEYSAYHWAQKALENAGGGLLFTEYFDGFSSGGTHNVFTGDLNTIFLNSRYLVNSTSTNKPTGGFGFVTTMVNTSGTFGSQQWQPNDGATAMYIRSTDGASNWGDWREVAEADDFVPIAGNGGNPMTGNLSMDNKEINGVRIIEMGNDTNQTTFIDFHSSSDPSQSDYSARILRNSGVNGDLQLTNLGTGAISLVSGANINLDPAGGFIACNNAIFAQVGTPVSPLDGVNKQYVDARVASGRWAKVQNGTGVPTIQRGNGITGITRVSNTYTMTLSSAINTNKDILLDTINGEESATVRHAVKFLRDQSTTTSIVFQIIDASGGANDISDFYITLTELL